MDCIFARPIFRMPIFKLQCQTKIMLYIICGSEFGKHQGKKALMIICRALNGGKSVVLSTDQLQLQIAIT